MNCNGTVLVVDDDPEALSLLAGVLQREGYRVQPADSGKLALLSVAAQPPDLILLDARMPGMDGFEVCRQLKESESGRRVPVIFVSASRDRQEWVQGLSLGAVDFISKPFQREELLARVKTHVELGQLRANLETVIAQRTSALNYAIEQMRLEVTERRRAELAVRESEEELRQVANAVPIIIWTSNARNEVEFRNDHAVLFTGRTMEQLTGDGWFEAVHPEDCERQRCAFADALAARKAFQFEYRLRRADGMYRDMLDSGTPRFLVNGDFGGFVGTVFDLTEIKSSQERAFREKNLENLRMFSAGIAHDFNSLIGAIFGEVDLALCDMAPDTPGWENVKRVEGVARRAADIVRLLLTYVGDPNDGTAAGPVNLSNLVQEIVPHLKAPALRKAQIRMSLTPALPSIWGNVSQIRLALLNLIINAVEATRGEDGVITIRTDLLEIAGEPTNGHGGQLCSGTYVKLEISDNGPGMTSDVQDRLFAPYFTTKLPGRGLGLAAVHGIIGSHRGNISVRSVPGEGSTFEVLLPVACGRSKANE